MPRRVHAIDKLVHRPCVLSRDIREMDRPPVNAVRGDQVGLTPDCASDDSPRRSSGRLRVPYALDLARTPAMPFHICPFCVLTHTQADATNVQEPLVEFTPLIMLLDLDWLLGLQLDGMLAKQVHADMVLNDRRLCGVTRPLRVAAKIRDVMAWLFCTICRR